MWQGQPRASVGIAGYRAICFRFHGIIVHRRIETGYVPRFSYMKRVVQAHRLRHVVESKEGTVSFGFICTPAIAALEALLAENARTGQAIVRKDPVGRNMACPAFDCGQIGSDRPQWWSEADVAMVCPTWPIHGLLAAAVSHLLSLAKE